MPCSPYVPGMEELDEARAREILRELHFGHLGLAKNGHAYVLPLYYTYDGKTVYFHSHPGLKEEYITATKEACFLAASIESGDDWESVQVFGPVEKVTVADEIRTAMNALISVPLPPAYGVSEFGEPKRSAADTFYWKVVPKRIEGRRSVRPPPSDDMALA